MHLIGAAVDLLPGDLRQPRHLRVSPERRLLFGHRQHRTQVLIARLNALRGEGGGNIGGPALTIAGVGRDQRQQPGFDVGGRAVGAVVVVLLVQPASASSAARLSKRKDIGWNKRSIGIFSLNVMA